VENHNSEIRQTAQSVRGMNVSGEMESVREALLVQMASVLTSNRRLQQDLTCTRYQMEDQAQELDHARREARTDPLTTIGNRKAFDEKLWLLLATFEKHGEPFSLILMDLDHFKRINDGHGHQAGDHVLSRLGELLKNWVRAGDLVARYGGDEFAVLLPRTELAAARELAERIRLRTAEEVSGLTFRGEQIALSFSVGVAVSREGDSPESLILRADRGMFQSKELGRNHVSTVEPEPAGPLRVPVECA
jgi:diguanylate cyclase